MQQLGWKLYQGAIIVAVAGSIESAAPHQYGIGPAVIGIVVALVATAGPRRIKWWLDDWRGRRGKP